nr:hypothetical protein [Pyrinomonadaceae bacterium]
MYRRPIFLEALLKIREDMAREADYDVDLFAERVRSGSFAVSSEQYDLSLPDEEKQRSKKNRTVKDVS